MHCESGSCWGLEHRHHHTLSPGSIQLCIPQVVNKDLPNRPCPLPSFSTCSFSSAEHPYLQMCLNAQAQPALPSQYQHIHTPFPHAVMDVLALGVAPSPAPATVLWRSHCLDGFPSIHSERLSEYSFLSKSVTSPFPRNFWLLICIYASLSSH